MTSTLVGPAPEPVDGADPELRIQSLERELVSTRAQAQAAYRDSARLIRLLAVLARPAAPEELIRSTLDALSQSFSADVVCLVRSRAVTLDADDAAGTAVVAACGFRRGAGLRLPPLPVSLRHVSPTATTWAAGLDPSRGTALEVAGLGMRSGARVPLSQTDWASGALLLLSVSPTGYSVTELQLLQSIAERLHAASEAAERRRTAERLAAAAPRFDRHLDHDHLLRDAVELVRELTGATWSGVVELSEADRSPALLAMSGTDSADDTDPVVRSAVRAALDAAARDATQVDDEGPGTARPGGTGSVLTVPLHLEAQRRLVLVAVSDQPCAFSSVAAEAVTDVSGALGAALETSELYRALTSSEQRLRRLTDAISDVVVVLDAAQTVTWVSPSCRRELGIGPGQLLGHRFTDHVHPADRRHFLDALHQRASARAAGTPQNDSQGGGVEHRVLDSDGTWVWVESRMSGRHDDGDVVLSCRLIGERRRLQEELRHRASHDALTGLANRDLMREHLTALLCEPASRGGLVGLVFCDLDEFKAVNDRLGHEAGDELLRLVARRLASRIGPRDLLARLGGDEFVVVLADVADQVALEATGERLLHGLRRPFDLSAAAPGREVVTVGASLGGATGLRGAQPGSAVAGRATTLLRDADAAMYEAKRRGRGRVHVFDATEARSSLEHLELRQRIQHALAAGELSLHYQPIVDLLTGRTTCVEALLRWTTADRGSIPPDVFVPLAEQTGAILRIGEWVLRQACADLRTWRDQGLADHVSVSVNVSPTQLVGPELSRHVRSALAEAGLVPQDLQVEITENLPVGSPGVACLRDLQELGVAAVIDDFGVGHAHLGQLNDLPVSGLKVDRSLIAGIGTGGAVATGLIRAVLDVGRTADLTVVAEGVEDDAQLTALQAMGCRFVQGYMFSRPVPVQQVPDLVQRSWLPATADRVH